MEFFQKHRRAIVTSLACVGGYYVLKAYWAPTPGQSTAQIPTTSSSVTPVATTGTIHLENAPPQESGEKWIIFTIPELGISLELPEDMNPNAFWSRTPLVKFGEQNCFYLVIFEDYHTKKESLKLLGEYDCNISPGEVITRKIGENEEYKGFEGQINNSGASSADDAGKKKWFFIVPSFKRTLMFFCEYDPKLEKEAKFLEIAKKAMDSIKIEKQRNIGTTKFFKKFLLSTSNSQKNSENNDEKLLKFALSIELPDLNFFSEKTFSENEIFHLRFAKVSKKKSAGIKLMHFANAASQFQQQSLSETSSSSSSKKRREFLSDLVDFYKTSLSQISNWKATESMEFDIADNSLSRVIQYDQIINEKTFHVTGIMFLKNSIPFLVIFYSYVKLLKFFNNSFFNPGSARPATEPTSQFLSVDQTLKSLNISLSTENFQNFASEFISYTNKRQNFSIKFPSKMKFINEKLDDVISALSEHPNGTGAPYIETSIGVKEKLFQNFEKPNELLKKVKEDLEREKNEAQKEIGDTEMHIISQELLETGCSFVYKFQNSLFTTESGNPIKTVVLLTCISHDDSIYTIKSQTIVEQDSQMKQAIEDMSAIHNTATFF